MISKKLKKQWIAEGYRLSKKDIEREQRRIKGKMSANKDIFSFFDKGTVAKSILYGINARSLTGRNFVHAADIVIVCLSVVDRFLERLGMSVADLDFFQRRKLQEFLVEVATDFLPAKLPDDIAEVVLSVSAEKWRDLFSHAILQYEDFVD